MSTDDQARIRALETLLAQLRRRVGAGFPITDDDGTDTVRLFRPALHNLALRLEDDATGGTNGFAQTALVANDLTGDSGASRVTLEADTDSHSARLAVSASGGATTTPPHPYVEFSLDTPAFRLFALAGVPSFNAGGNIGSLCVDTANGDLYINTDGATTWKKFTHA